MRLRPGSLPPGAQQKSAWRSPLVPIATPRQQRCVAVAALKSRAAAGDATSQHQEVLQQLLQLDDQGLRQWLREEGNRGRASLDFLSWLAGRVDAASEGEKAWLDALGGKLTALREGTDSTAAAEWLQALRDSPLPPSPDSSSSGGSSSTELQVRQRQQELARRRAEEALSLPQLSHSHEKTAELGREMAERRAASAAQLIGRAPVQQAAAEAGLSAAGAADRILSALLSIPDARERLATLPEAFRAPEPDAQGSADEELLHTTPMRLLQAIGVAQSRLQQGRDPLGGGHDPRALPGVIPMSDSELTAALEQLRRETFRCWEAGREPHDGP